VEKVGEGGVGWKTGGGGCVVGGVVEGCSKL